VGRRKGQGRRREEGKQKPREARRGGENDCMISSLLRVLHISFVTSLVASSADTRHSSREAAGAGTHDTQYLSSALVASFPDFCVQKRETSLGTRLVRLSHGTFL